MIAPAPFRRTVRVALLAGAPGTAPVASAIRGDGQKIVTLGLNWYPNQVVRFQADYQHVDVNRLSPGGTAFGAGALTPPRAPKSARS